MYRFLNVLNLLKVFLCGIIFLVFNNAADAQIKIGTNGSIIAPSSLLELESANQGLLLPRLADTAAINALSPPNGMLIYLTKAPAVGLYVRKVNGWEYITGSLAGNGNFNSLTVANAVTAGSFSGPLNGNASSATLAATATNSLNSAIANDITTPAVTYPTFVTATPGNAPLRTSNSNLSFVPATGILTAKGFVGPLVGNVTGNSTSSVDAINTVNVRVTDDLVTPTTLYPLFATASSGPAPARASSARLGFIPLTGELTAPIFRGDLLGNASSATTVTGNVAAVNGGTGQSVYTPGDLLYATTSNTLSKLPIGVPGTVLRVTGLNTPAWSTAGAGTVTNVTGVANRISVVDPTVAPVIDISSNYIGQSSITTVGPLSSGSLAPGFTAVNVGQGGTGRNTLTPNAILYGNGTGAVGELSGAAGLVLTSNGPSLAPSFQAPGVGDMVLVADQTVTGEKIFNDGKLRLNGSVSGITTLIANSNSSGTVTLPPSGTIVNRDAVETLTNKTIFSPTLTGTPNLGSAIGTSLNIGGNVTAGSFTGPLTGNVTGNASGSAGSFTGALAGDVTGTQGNTAVAFVGGVTASNVANGANIANTATATNVNNSVVSRDASGNFVAGTISAALNGNANTATSAATATTATSAVNVGITNDNASVAIHYPTYVTGTSGNLPEKTSSLGLTYVPSTGLLSAIRFASTVATGTAPFAVSSTTPVANLSIGGNAATASALAPGRTINGTAFDGTSNITVTADANTLTGSTLNSTVVTSSLTSLGTVSTGVWNGTVITGQYGGTGVANTGRTITLGGNLTTSGANALTLTTTAATNVSLPTSGTLYGSAASSISSANLLGSLTDETGNGSAVFSISPVLTTPNIGNANATTIRGNSVAPSFSLAGTGITPTVTGTNLAGQIQILSTGAIAGGSSIVTITYTSPFPLSSYPILYPANPAAAELTGTSQIFAVGTDVAFSVTAGTAGLPAGTYIWNYQVMGN